MTAIHLVGSQNFSIAMRIKKMDFRDYGIGAQILVELGIRKIRILSGTNRKVVGLDGYDLEIVEQINV